MAPTAIVVRQSGKAMISIVLEKKMNIIDSTCSRLHNLMIVTAHHRVGALLTAHP
jgi:molybdopterin synthase catalytic subunit